VRSNTYAEPIDLFRFLCSQEHLPLGMWLAFLVALSLGLWTAAAVAQAPSPPSASDQTGAQAYGAYHGGDIDSVGLTNGALTLNAPFLSYPQRGKLKLDFNLMYNNQPQHTGYLCLTIPNQGTQCTWTWGWMTTDSPLPLEMGDVFVGWAEQVALAGSGKCGGPCTILGNSTTYSNWSLQAADGGKHVLGNQGTLSFSTNSACCLPSVTTAKLDCW
jgi:hypothetical protein